MTTTAKYYSLNLLDSEGCFVPFDNGAYHLAHGTKYKIMLTSGHPDRRANATVYVDDAVIGVFRLSPGKQVIIERPEDQTRRLTFYKTDSAEGRAGCLTTHMGKIRVEVVTEGSERRAVVVADSLECDGETGGTALSAASEQRFYNAPDMSVDMSTVCVLEARMKIAPPPKRPVVMALSRT